MFKVTTWIFVFCFFFLAGCAPIQTHAQDTILELTASRNVSFDLNGQKFDLRLDETGPYLMLYIKADSASELHTGIAWVEQVCQVDILDKVAVTERYSIMHTLQQRCAMLDEALGNQVDDLDTTVAEIVNQFDPRVCADVNWQQPDAVCQISPTLELDTAGMWIQAYSKDYLQAAMLATLQLCNIQKGEWHIVTLPSGKLSVFIPISLQECLNND